MNKPSKARLPTGKLRAEVLAPPELRREVAREAKELAGLYGHI
ncbi:WYL domain-containing protein [Neomoorella mulderi]|nr:WYL domain-containing protein [Moorella mulderi]